MQSSCAANVSTHCPVSRSHSFKLPSLEPLTARLSAQSTETQFTLPPWPHNLLTSSARSKSHSTRVLSLEPCVRVHVCPRVPTCVCVCVCMYVFVCVRVSLALLKEEYAADCEMWLHAHELHPNPLGSESSHLTQGCQRSVLITYVAKRLENK